jgi:hypothetical protein
MRDGWSRCPSYGVRIEGANEIFRRDKGTVVDRSLCSLNEGQGPDPGKHAIHTEL